MIFAFFAIFNKLYNFYYGQHFYNRYKTYSYLQGRPLAINTELQGSKGSPGHSRRSKASFHDFVIFNDFFYENAYL